METRKNERPRVFLFGLFSCSLHVFLYWNMSYLEEKAGAEDTGGWMDSMDGMGWIPGHKRDMKCYLW